MPYALEMSGTGKKPNNYKARLRELANPLRIGAADERLRKNVLQYFRASLKGCYGSMADYLLTVPRGMTRWKGQETSIEKMSDHIRSHLSVHEFSE